MFNFDVGEVDSFLGQEPPKLSSTLGLSNPPSSTILSGNQQFSNIGGPLQSSQDLFQQHSLTTSIRPPQGYAPQPFSVPQPQSQVFSVQQSQPYQLQQPSGITHSFGISEPLPSNTPSTYIPSSSPVLEVAPVSVNSSKVFPTAILSSEQSLSGLWNSPSQHGNVIHTNTLKNPTSVELGSTIPQPLPLFEVSNSQTNTPSQQHDIEDTSSVPFLGSPSQYQSTSNLRSNSPFSPPVATVAPLAGTTNTYRIGNQKKPLYAQPPGLSFSASFSPAAPITSLSNLSLSSTSNSFPSFVTAPVTPNIGMATQASTTATLTPMQLPSPTPLQYHSPVNAENQSPPSVLPPSFTNLAQFGTMYRPVYHHWFYKKEVENKVLWQPFSMVDSLSLEEAFTSTEIAPETLVSTDGGRYDVNILRRQKSAVYWQESPSEVRRCSWFYKGSADTRYVPYEENVSTRLEEEFKIATTTNTWHRRVEFPNGETVVFHGPGVMVHFLQATSPDSWGNTPQTPLRPRVVKRGVDEFDIDEGEPAKVDHLLFLVHGIGSVCDLKFRTVEEVVDDFRSLSLQLVQSHFRSAMDQGKVNRIEVLPISWHATLHGEDTGIDRKLKSITLNSIPKLRHFTNDTLLDILFYTSPVYCQTIMHTVGKELNRLYKLFKERNPTFEGGISLGGHSLGSLILFDLLYHQKPPEEESIPSSRDSSSEPQAMEEDKSENMKVAPSQRKLNQSVSYIMGNAGTGQPFIKYPQLDFQPKSFFALGSPIGMFVTVRGIETLGEDFKLPTCPGFFNIFHPFDPVAYRIETLVNPELTTLRPVLIPHHKGRKRMHLELKETMARVGADLKQRLMDSVRSTWNTVYQLAMFHRSDSHILEEEVDKVLEEQLHQQNQQDNDSCHSGTEADCDMDICVGQLNSGRRIDFVLQEAPLESFNEYIFALKTHVCYWESEDTMLMILKEVYSTLGISADSQIPQQNLPSSTPHSYSGNLVFPTSSGSSNNLVELEADEINNSVNQSQFNQNHIEPPIATFPIDLQSSSLLSGPNSPTPNFPNISPQEMDSSQPIGMDPTAPPSEHKNLGPPPIAGFVRK